MFPNSPYAKPVGSFPIPVDLIGVDPDAEPTVQICVNQKWLPYIAGALKQLLLQATWDTNDPNALWLQQERVFSLFSIIARAQACKAEPPPTYEEFVDMVQFREDCNCNLFYKCCDGTEKQLATVASVPPSGNTSGGEPQPPSGGGSQSYCKSFNANAVSLIPAPLNTGDVITLSSADGSGYDGAGTEWYCPTGDQLFVSCQPGTGFLRGTDPLPTSNHMSLIVKIGSNYYPIAVGSPLTVPSGVSNAQAWIQVNDDTLNNNFGSYDICYTVQNNQLANWFVDLDLTVAQHGLIPTAFAPFPEPSSTAWVLGKGFVGTGGGGGDYTVGAVLLPTSGFSGFIDQIIITAYSESNAGQNQLGQWLLGGTVVSPTTQHNSAIVPSTNAPIDHMIVATEALSTPQWVTFDVEQPGTPVGDIVLSRLRVSGRGQNPFV